MLNNPIWTIAKIYLYYLITFLPAMRIMMMRYETKVQCGRRYSPAAKLFNPRRFFVRQSATAVSPPVRNRSRSLAINPISVTVFVPLPVVVDDFERAVDVAGE